MRDIVEQIYDELNAQVIRMLEHERKQTDRIVELEHMVQELDSLLGKRLCQEKRCAKFAELEAENLNLRYELNAALSGGMVSCPTATAVQAPVREVPETHKLVPLRPNWNMLDALYGKDWSEKSPAEQVGMVQAYRKMLDATALELPTAPIATSMAAAPEQEKPE